MALIAAARGVVSNDSGLMHVAAAFGVPQAALFGSTSPEHTPPLNPRARVLWLKEELQLDCAPCFDRVCRFGHTRCLSELAPQRVQAALDDACWPRAEAALADHRAAGHQHECDRRGRFVQCRQHARPEDHCSPRPTRPTRSRPGSTRRCSRATSTS